jgi:hypothetical protein
LQEEYHEANHIACTVCYQNGYNLGFRISAEQERCQVSEGHNCHWVNQKQYPHTRQLYVERQVGKNNQNHRDVHFYHVS